MICTRTTGLLAAALLGALLLAGCGGGGGEPTVSQSVHDVLQHELDEALADLRAEREAKAREAAGRRTAEAQATRLTGEAARLTGERDTATAEVARLEGLIGAATDAADAAESASLHAQLNHATAEVTRLTGELTTATGRVAELETLVGDATNPAATSLRGQIAAEKAKAAKLEADLATEKARVTVLTGRLGTAEAAVTEAEEKVEEAEQEAQQARTEAERRIEEAETQANVAARAEPLVTTLMAEAPGSETATVMHTRGSSLVFKPSGTWPTRGSAPSISGWRSGSFSRPKGANATETAYLYSNIQAPGTRAFWKVHGVGPITITEAQVTAKMAVPSTSTRAVTADGMPVSESNVETGRTTSGTFDGASGTFSCTGAAGVCTVTRGANNALIIGGDWTFAPNASGFKRGVQRNTDEAYLWFGIWLEEPKTASAAHTFRWIRGGVGAITPANYGRLSGEATFTGGAVGKYALKAAAGRDASIGTFTAKAVFTADFTATPNTLDGQISDFREGGRSLDGWSVGLIQNETTTGAELTAAGANGEAHGSIGDVAAEGNWSAMLYGVDNMDLSGEGAIPPSLDSAGYTSDKYPAADVAGVSGWFNAATGDDNAAIAGAFGAACTTGTMCAK